MSVQLHIVNPPNENPFYYTYMDDPGAMFRWSAWDVDDRECWVISLPNKAGIWWTTYKEKESGKMWDVVGAAPNITVYPSINAGDGNEPGNWHGWIKDGIMEP